MQKKTKKIIMLTILLLIILAIILLIQNTTKQMPQMLTEQAKAEYTTQIGDKTYDITHAVLEANEITPTISAGMIPIKWNGENFVITTFDDTNWYDYSKGIPAYIMLNDGYYQSELIQDMTNKELAENSVGNDALVVPNAPNNNPTIYMYIPRFAYNTQGKILYIKQGCSVAGTYTIPEIFTYQAEKRDFSLAGIWVEYTPLASTSTVNTKVNNMKGENNKYGFIANTIATNANNEPSYKTTIETYNQYIANIVWVGVPDDPSSTEYLNTVGNETNVVPQINEPTNLNRTILKITNSNQPEPIKAYGYYDETEEKIKIEVTYRTNAISQIIDANNNILSKNSTTAETTNANQIFVVDNKGNYKKVKIKDIYIISNKLELEEFRNDVNNGLTTANTRAFQIADIELNEGKYTIYEVTEEITFAEDAEQWIPIGVNYGGNYFRGTYQGNGHKITGIYINNKDNNYQGLFGYCVGAQIKNIGIENGYIYGNNNVGGVIGYLYPGEKKKAIVNGCYNNAKIVGKQYIGGIVGNSVSYNGIGSIIKNCYNKGNVLGTYGYVGGIAGGASNSAETINCYNLGKIVGEVRIAGGIVGVNIGATITNCYNLGEISKTKEVGGIAGNSYGSNSKYISVVTLSYNIGRVIGTSQRGAIVGQNGNDYYSSAGKYAKVENCYYLSGSASSGVGTTVPGTTITTYARTQDQMPTVLSVINSDNAFIEDTNNINNGYPLLAWQVETSD